MKEGGVQVLTKHESFEDLGDDGSLEGAAGAVISRPLLSHAD